MVVQMACGCVDMLLKFEIEGPFFRDVYAQRKKNLFLYSICFWINRKWCTLRRTCDGIHQGRIESASPIELTTSRTEALQAPTALCELTRDFHLIISQSCIAKDSRSEEVLLGPTSPLIVHVFSWPPVRLRHVRGGWGRSRSFTIRTSFFAWAVTVY